MRVSKYLIGVYIAGVAFSLALCVSERTWLSVIVALLINAVTIYHIIRKHSILQFNIFDLGESLCKCTNSNALLRHFCKYANKVIGGTSSAVIIIDEESKIVQCLATSMDSADKEIQCYPLNNDSPLLDTALLGTSCVIDNSNVNDTLRALLPDSRSIFVQPLRNYTAGRGYLLIAISKSKVPEHIKSIIEIVSVILAKAITDNGLKDILNKELAKIGRICHISSQVGPQAPMSDVRKAIVDTVSDTFDAGRVALFMIDPCMGGIDCDATPSVNKELQDAFLELYGDFVSDRERHTPHIQQNIPDMICSNPDAKSAFAEASVQSLIACPVRSEVGASGAIVVFFSNNMEHPEQLSIIMGIVADLVSATISYALALEQSGQLLDELAGANHKLSIQATSDGLTGLANHRTLQQTLSEMCKVSASRRKDRIFSVVMADVDHFKMYNDTHGHREGDKALRDVAKIISAGLRQSDLAARYGGEEFALVLKGVNKNAALRIANRIRRSIAEHEFGKGSMTISMGIAEYPSDGSTPGEIIERADQSLYHAKITGRNRVVVWGSSGCSLDQEENNKDDLTTANKTLLIVEKLDKEISSAVKEGLKSQPYTVDVSESTTKALELLKTRSFDIVIMSEYVFPDGNIKLLNTFAAIHPDMPIVLVANKPHVEYSREAMRRGASDILNAPFTPQEIPILIERNIERRHVERQRLAQKSTGIMLQAIEALVAAIDAKDHFTAGHSQHVTSLALSIADELNLSSDERYALELAARIHDIGKLGLPDSALNKDSHLTEDEWLAMREHPALGSKIVGAIDELAYISTVIRHHHEKLDGSGYPDGLSGEAIPYLAQIISVADSYEAMTSERAHRSRLNPKEAIKELKKYAGIHYNPQLVQCLATHLINIGEVPKDFDINQAA